VSAFRDTWENGVHSYLDYVRDRIRIGYELLSETGSIFFQIGEQNIHLVRSVLDEVFLPSNHITTFIFNKTGGSTSEYVPGVYDGIIWYAKEKTKLKYRQVYRLKNIGGQGSSAYGKAVTPEGQIKSLSKTQKASPETIPGDWRVFRVDNITSQSVGREKGEGAASWFPVSFAGKIFKPSEKVRWKTNELGMERLAHADRLTASANNIYYIRYIDDFRAFAIDNVWSDTVIAGFASDKQYVVETSPKVVERCLLFATDPGDLVLDPTCGSGTTAYVAEQWGRRWITIDTSRVALTLARFRIMGARFSFYALKDSEFGAIADEELRLRRKLTRDEANAARARGPFTDDIATGFVYHRAPHVTLRSIVNNAEIDVIWATFQATLESLRDELNKAADVAWEEWQIPRPPVYPWPEKASRLHAKIRDLLDERGDLIANRDRGASETDERDVATHDRKIAKALKELNGAIGLNYNLDTLPEHAGDPLPPSAVPLHAAWWKARLERQSKIDASITANAVDEPLVDRPYEVRGIVRVAGPFTFDSLSPHRVLPANEDDPFFLAQLDYAGELEHRISSTRLARRAAQETGTEATTSSGSFSTI
jgi:adenine-specific DNA-methyltransferase